MSDRGYKDRHDRYDRGVGGYRDQRSGGRGYRLAASAAVMYSVVLVLNINAKIHK